MQNTNRNHDDFKQLAFCEILNGWNLSKEGNYVYMKVLSFGNTTEEDTVYVKGIKMVNMGKSGNKKYDYHIMFKHVWNSNLP